MAALDAAIHEKYRTFTMWLDGRVKPGHDNGRAHYFIDGIEGGNPSPLTWNSKVLDAVFVGPRLHADGGGGACWDLRRLVFIASISMGLCCSAFEAVGQTPLLPFEISGDAVLKPLGGLKGDERRGEEIVRDRRVGNCLICHQFPFRNEPFQGDIGPAMKGAGTRLTAGQIRLRLIDESLLNPATVMPPYYRIENLTNVAPEYAGLPGLTEQQIEDVVSYLASLRQ
jgi:L-cysteine S-thiosulfotransferase